ncbi:MAG: amidohydrolase family protein [Henriciella sp.]
MKLRKFIERAVLGGTVTILAACSAPQEGPDTEPSESSDTATYHVFVQGTNIGAVEATPTETGYNVFYEYRNNGRGPTINETITLSADGLPIGWTAKGNTTFGNAVDESFTLENGIASWTDSTGTEQATVSEPTLYVAQNGSPFGLAVTAKALLADPDNQMPALPGGTLRLDMLETIDVTNVDGAVSQATTYALSGTSYNPTYFLMQDSQFFGYVSPRMSILAEGFDGEDERLRGLAAEYGARRYEEIQARTVRSYDQPIRVQNVRLFDPATESIGDLVSVTVQDGMISAIEAADASSPGEISIEGAGGTLVPGLFEMHAHLGQQSALLNIAAGVTTVRDTGNDNEVLSDLIEKLESGRLAGPEVFRSGFIEGRSPFNSNNGILVETEAQAVAAVDTYADQGVFHQIKIYNSMNPDWVPAMVERARVRGLRVTGHVPAFSNANQMIDAGYDEMTHINQVMLGWVLEQGEDTRTLLRLTALKRLPALDLTADNVKATLDAMIENQVAIDPTLAIHEALLLSRNGVISAGSVDIIDHLPVNAQRQAKTAWAAIESDEDDRAYAEAFEQIKRTLALMRERGIFMVPGTDLGGSFAYHRELELYQSIGMEPGEILAWASQGMADYLGAGDRLGSISPGKEADFFLIAGDPTEDFKAIKAISMVVADGDIYFPSEIYPEFGIKPFVEAPPLTEPN